LGNDNVLKWLEPWYAPDGEERGWLEEELAKEICERHELYGQAVSAIAKDKGSDDALFLLPDGRVAHVHLTWKGRRETDPIWPVTAIFPSQSAWAEEVMIPLHQKYWARD
jgi:hypothetical protein